MFRIERMLPDSTPSLSGAAKKPGRPVYTARAIDPEEARRDAADQNPHHHDPREDKELGLYTHDRHVSEEREGPKSTMDVVA